jgi:hypothetical protein
MEEGHEMEMVGFGTPGCYGSALDLNPDITLQRVSRRVMN